MASTYRPIRAFDVCKVLIKNLPFEDIGWQILDRVNKIMWMAAPWRWSLGSLNTITLASNTQDYVVTKPSDFLYVVEAYVNEGEGNRPLVVVPTLLTDVGTVGYPTRIAYNDAGGGNLTARVAPKPGTILASPTQKIYSLYKKTAPNITQSNSSTAGVLLFDDEWFWVFESGVVWLAYLYADDQRAGEAQMDVKSGQYRFTGARAVFEANVQLMKEREKLPDISVVPSGQTPNK